MSLSTVISVGLGLILIYYALGLIVNATTEVVKISFDLRAKALSAVLSSLMEEKSQEFMQLGLIQTLKPLAKRLWTKERDVAEIPKRTFSLAILELLQPKDKQYLVTAVKEALNQVLDRFPLDAQTRQRIENLLTYETDKEMLAELREVIRTLPDEVKGNDIHNALLNILDLLLGSPETQLVRIRAGIQQLPPESKARKALENAINFGVDDIDSARARIEAWYDDAMKNASDLFIRRVRRWVILISLIVTLTVGGDTIAIARTFIVQPVQMTQVEDFLNQFPPDVTVPSDEEASLEQIRIQTQLIADILQNLEGLNLPLPWWRGPLPDTVTGWVTMILGLMFTWLAVSQGSSFWYDILKAIKPGSSPPPPPPPKSGDNE
ncbi:MAG: hypothetical protein BroJett015_46130 [Chloroflexota bacterium]|nr:hypothetical protein [Ardenticatenaceae bacterium]GIK58950.1 MAG: hypothetical protein BroJett015_46130 [Chloroflexota bacterium]